MIGWKQTNPPFFYQRRSITKETGFYFSSKLYPRKMTYRYFIGEFTSHWRKPNFISHSIGNTNRETERVGTSTFTHSMRWINHCHFWRPPSEWRCRNDNVFRKRSSTDDNWARSLACLCSCGHSCSWYNRIFAKGPRRLCAPIQDVISGKVGVQAQEGSRSCCPFPCFNRPGRLDERIFATE